MFREHSRAKLRQPSVFIMLQTAFLVFLIPVSHAMCRPNLCWPCSESRRLSFQAWQLECRWAHPHEGAGLGGRCAQRLVRAGGRGWGVCAPRARGNRCCNEDECPGSFVLAKLIQIFGVLALADSLLPLPVTVWEPELSSAGPVSWSSLDKWNNHQVWDTLLQLSHMASWKSTPLPLRKAEEDKTVDAVNWNWICRWDIQD